MFGPNTHTSVNSIINNSHRDNEFFEKVINTRNLFQKTFNLENYDIVFIPGSGTIGMESVIWSINKQIKMN
jgi:aspartate aminotransferase-like enzyme